MMVTVKKPGGSLTVVVPETVAREMGLIEGAKLHVTASAASIVLRKQSRRPRRPLSRIVAQIKPASYRQRTRELSEDAPVGREIW